MRKAIDFIVPRLDVERRPEREPLSKLWQEFLGDAGLQLEASTLRNYRRTRELMCGPGKLSDYPSPREVAAWLSRMRASGMKPGTVRLHRDNAHHLYRYSNATGAAVGNPVARCPWRS